MSDRLSLISETCDLCANAAVHVRTTQFSGDHLFCEDHARFEEDFGKEDQSYFFWYTYTRHQENLRKRSFESYEREQKFLRKHGLA